MNRGFSLIELMVVVAIISTLTAIALPNYQKYVKKSELSAALATLHNLKTPVEEHIVTNGSFPTIDNNSDMLAQLGASQTTLGPLTTRQDDNQAQSGQIIINLSGTQFRESDTQAYNLALERSASGVWSCITDIPSTENALYPKGCEQGEVL